MNESRDKFTAGPGIKDGSTEIVMNGFEDTENGNRRNVHTIKTQRLYSDALLRLGENQHDVVGR